MRKKIDAPLAVALHRDNDCSVREIAARFDCCCPAIYRAFRAQGYITGNMAENRKPHEPAIYLPPAALGPLPPAGRTAMADKTAHALPVVHRDPCFRCGVRGDIGCKCNKAPVGWHTGTQR